MPAFRNQKGAILIHEMPFTPMANQPHVSIALPATVHTLNVPKGASHVIIQAIDQDIMFTLDGSAPTATHGFRIRSAAANEWRILDIVDGRTTLRFLRAADGAVLQYQYGES